MDDPTLISRVVLKNYNSETLDQPGATAFFDPNQAAGRSDSFDKCYREITSLILRLR